MRQRHELKFDDSNTLVLYVWKNEKMATIGSVQLVHGMSENILRYDDFATFLANHGFFVVGCDHVAHGESAKSIDQIGIIENQDFMTAILKDMKLVHDMYSDEFKRYPSCLFAHSMGAMAAERYVEQYPRDFDKLVLSGADIGTGRYRFLAMLTKNYMNFHGTISYSKQIDKLTMGSFEAPFVKKGQSKLSWLSYNTDNVEAYEANPYCNKHYPVNYYHSLAKLLVSAKKKKNLKKINPNLEILLLSGKDDPVTNYTKSTKLLYKMYQKQGLETYQKIYSDARHEIINEQSCIRDVVYHDILNFFTLLKKEKMR
jgi:alpha-beta hydrolase superfamily lysophospholipase